MSKASEPPTCRVCGVAHWGTCMNHAARGAIADQAPVARRTGIKSPKGAMSAVTSDLIRPATRDQGPEDSRAKAPKGKAATAKGREQRPAPAGRGASRPRPGRAEAPASKKAVKKLRDKGDIIPAEAVKRGRGRPKTVTDRKAYKAQKERERRAKKKTEAST